MRSSTPGSCEARAGRERGGLLISPACLLYLHRYVLGPPAMQRMREAKVLLSGLQGLGAEVAKNLVLMGVGSLTLHDPCPTCWSDLAAQFLLSERDLGRSRAEASRELLAQLNEAVQVSVHLGDITEAFLLDFQVVVLTASKLEEQLKVGAWCHKHGVCFLVADSRGLVGQLFCDFGENFTVQDPTEAEPLTATIQHISQGCPGIVTLRRETVTHSFRDGHLVTFSGIEGMVELNGCDPRPIRVQEDWSLEIGDTAAFSRYLRGGTVTEVKRAKTVNHVDAEAVVCLARALGPLKGTDEEPLEEPLDEALVRITALSSAGSLSPMAALLGAVAAQEVLKAISGKFVPLDQWLYFDALDCLPEDGDVLPKPEDCIPRGCRYDGQIAVFGAGFQEKLSRQHYLLVGAGAIGCELLKGFALVGLGAGGGGSVTVADMDHVERSNLSRQFLFRPQDIGRPKAEVAAVAAQRLNPDLQVTPLTHPLDPTTEHVYGDHFFSRVHGVAAALDSFQARHYVATRCTHYLKPLLEAGTEGTKGSAAVFVPYVTEGYKAPGSAEDTSYPVCTVRHFPSTAEHTLQWARDEFEGLFRLSAETINRARQAPPSLADMDGPQTLALLRPVLGVLRARPQTWEDCVVWARGHWQLRFHYGIIQLLSHIPPDRVLEDGTLFWSGLKQCPQPLEFAMDQENHLLFVLAAANLYARMHGLAGSPGLTALKGLLKSLPQTDPQLLAPILAMAPERAQASAEFGPELLKELQEVLEVWSEHPALNPLMFEKDDDSNFHMDFVTAAANLRSQNYGIPPVTRAQGKQIVGRIIPAIATTTAAVAGLVGLELYKVVDGPRTLGAYRHSYLHLAENRLLRWVPSAPAIQMFQSLEWTCWRRLKVSAGQPERSLQWLLAHIQEQHGLRVRMLLHGTALLYSAGWSPAKQAQFLPLRVTELVQQVTGRALEPGLRVLVLELSCEGEEEDTAFPPLHYEL
ncbi:ubiquitin-like modifier-activating enzyme 7 isoform X5 [Lepus europaeus]|uniref:ubiquitin-like modifier-activating enzyme 7 isoform X5 n=1 Tax=Lepus europaeus TaxID=9983 RepID=UPI002B45FA8C|nr:ubiquitin-like modifier-activating enzyme 7 isoform X5 [Lepus europaeus]